MHGGRGEAGGGNALGGAVALADLDDGLVIVQELIELLFQLDRQRIAAGEHALEAAQIGLFHVGQAQQCLIQRGHARDEIALVLGNQLGIALGGKARHQHAPAALGEHGVDAHAQTKAVEDRHGGQHAVAGTEHGVGGDDLLGQGVEIQIRQHNALGGAGGAARIEDDRGIFGLALHLIAPEAGLAEVKELLPADDRRVVGNLADLAAFGKHIARFEGLGQLIPDAGDDDVDDIGVVADGFDFMIELIQRDYRHAVGFVQIEFDFLFAGQGMHHVGDTAHHVDGVEHGDGLRAVGHGDGNAIVFADADGFKRLGAALHMLQQLPVGGGASHEIHGDVVGVFIGHGLEHIVHGALEIIQMRGDIAQVLYPRGLGGDFIGHQ